MANKLIQLSDGNDLLFPIGSFESLTSATNLDNVKRSTNAWCNNVGGKPSGVTNTYGWLELVWDDTNGIGIQKYYVFGTTGIVGMYIRCFVNNQWYAWKQIQLA